MTKFVRLILAVAGIVMWAAPHTGIARQQTPASASPSAEPPTFYRDVLPILQQHCQVCHRPGEIGLMPLVTFDQVRPFARAIATATTTKRMPPWFADPTIGHFSNDPSLSPEEIATLSAWVNANVPAGDPRAAPPPRAWARGWMIPQPDTVVEMPMPVAIPAHGDVEYTYEIVHTRFTEDKWVRFSEVRPSNRMNVHHAVVYVRPPNSKWLPHAPIGVPFTGADMTDEQDRNDTHFTTADILLVYAPGSSPDNWNAGMAKMIPAGSDLVFQMHYMAHGRATTDRTSVGMVFAKEPPKQRVLTLQLTNDTFIIPPGVPDFRVEVHGSIPNDALLLSFFPHMHLRGKKFEYNIVAPDGESNGKSGGKFDGRIEPLLRVNYDFYWQLSYRLAEPLPLKAGTILQAVAWYDNSKNNAHNPDPNVAVRWGDQTYDEMMVGFFDVAVPANIDKTRFFIREKPSR
jgi:mono/diheme cytochrome c family protein